MATSKISVTKEECMLKTALEKKGVKVIMEHNDGFKRIDLYLPDAKLNIEVDGLQHLTDPTQILRDLHRQYYAEKSGHHTLHIPNIAIRHYLDQIVSALVEVVIMLKLERLQILENEVKYLNI